MSRTRHHKNQKHAHEGHDLWSRRPCAGLPYSAYYKKLTIRMERARKAKIILDEMPII